MSRDETPLPAADALRSDATRRGRRGYFVRRAGGEGAAGRTRLLRSEISSRGESWRGAGTRNMCAAFFQAVDEVLDGVDVPTNMG